jgi:predicted  nucleic acid-binding Zn-ribbon protein
MDIDRIAKEWPEMKRRLDALEQGGRPQSDQSAGPAQQDQLDQVQQAFDDLKSEAQQLMARIEEATAALELAREALDAARKEAPDAATESAIRDVSGEVRPGTNIHGIGPDTDGGPNPDYRPEGDDAV